MEKEQVPGSSAATVLMDNYELSGEDYAQFKSQRKDADWVSYLRERAQVDWTDAAAFARRLQHTRTVRVNLNTPSPQRVLFALPMPEQIKHLSLVHNHLQGNLDLSRFTHLEMLTLSGNPALPYTGLMLPESLRHIVLSNEAQNRLGKTDFKEKHPGISFSQNGNPGFTPGVFPFRQPEMVAVEGGKFWMGSWEGDSDASDAEFPAHPVQLSGYAIGKYLVTVEEFACFVEETGYVTVAEREGWSVAGIWQQGKLGFFCPADCNWRHDVYGQPVDNSHARHPVIHVTWDDAMAYCGWLNQKTGKTYSLPTEAQWEFAAIGGHQALLKDDAGFYHRKFRYAGTDDLKEAGWFFDKFEGNPPDNYGTKPVGLLQPNELGLYDMSGNVWEWCLDRHDPGYYKQCKEAGLVKNPAGPEQGANRMFRGGGWGRDAAACRIANRRRSSPDDRGDAAGFRVCFA